MLKKGGPPPNKGLPVIQFKHSISSPFASPSPSHQTIIKKSFKLRPSPSTGNGIKNLLLTAPMLPALSETRKSVSPPDNTQSPSVKHNDPTQYGALSRKSAVLPTYISTLLQSSVQHTSTTPRPVTNMESRKHLKKKNVQVIDPRFTVEQAAEAPNAVVTDKTKTIHDLEVITSALAKHFIFTNLSEENRVAIIEAMKFYRLPAQEVVFKQGESATNFFILASGKLEVLISGRQVNVLTDGVSFGELALLHDTPRSATIRSLEPSTLWGVDRLTFRQSLQVINAQNYAENKAFICSVGLFSTLTNPQKESLVHALASHIFISGHKIVNEGDPGDLFYIIKEGVVICTVNGVEVRRLSKGEFFGEQALLYGGTRTASVTADGQVKCVSICRDDLVQVLGSQLQHIIYRNTQRIAFEKSAILSRLTKEQCDKLISAMMVKTYTSGQVVVQQGSPKGVILWIVLKGALGTSLTTVTVDTPGCLGEEELTIPPDGVFETNIIAIGKEVHVAEIERQDFEKSIGGALEQATLNNEALDVLKRVQLLRGLPQERLKLLIGALQIREYNPEEVIVQQHNPGDMFFIIKSGKVNVLKDGVTIRTITKHDYFGERSILFDDFRSATVIAKGPVSCWILHKTDFLRVVNDTMRQHLLRRIELQDDNISLSSLIIVKSIGRGMFGNVFLAVHATKGTLYALKTVSRRKVDLYDIHENLLLERQILLQLDHVLVVKLVKTFKDEKRLYFLMEYVKGMDLFDVLRKLGLLNDDDSRFYVAAMVLMMEHLHDRDIIYRDLKPENVMIDDEGYPKLIDFGTAKIVHGRTYTIVGTPHYMAPEVIMGKGYGVAVDYYSIGVILYELLCGGVPFGEEEEDPYRIYQCVLEHRLSYPHFIDPRFPSRSLVEQLLHQNPAMRTGGSIEHLKAHKWFRTLDWVIYI